MDILQKLIGIALIFLGIAYITSSCQKSTETEKAESSTQKDTSNAIAKAVAKSQKAPEMLKNFTNIYTGSLGELEVQINLRRYGSSLFGEFWVKNTQGNYTLEGQVNDQTYDIQVNNERGNSFGRLEVKVNEEGALLGSWKASDGRKKEVKFAPITEDVDKTPIKIDDIEVIHASNDDKRKVRIVYPQVAGINSCSLLERINYYLERYFHSETLIKEVNDKSSTFAEYVKYEITYLSGDYISVCKHHHLSRDKDTQLFDDSHGMTLNYRTGQQFELRDLFVPNGLDQLNAIIQERMNKSCGGVLDAETLKTTYISAEETRGFSLSKDKITFHLTERLPYKYRGCGYVRIEYKDVKHLFNPSGPLPKILENWENTQKQRQQAIEKLKVEQQGIATSTLIE